ncbi:MAG: DNRLRE domain-containing protein [Deltaproteobacteria bacterium]|nr:DNRLRE domain-containing protein [Deltaproteobacteria bacterium]
MKTVLTLLFPFLLIFDVLSRCDDSPKVQTIWVDDNTGMGDFEEPYNSSIPDDSDKYDPDKCVRDVIRFANNINGYHGCTDIELQQEFPDDATATDVELMTDQVVDEDIPYTSEAQILIAMKNIFGYGAYQIPPDARITNAWLTVYATDESDCEIAAHRMLADWNADTTWNMLGGVSTNDVEAVAVADDVLPEADADRSHTFDVTASLHAWQENPDENRGWAILNRCDDGWRILSSETSLAERRPRLTVEVCGALPEVEPNMPPKVLKPDSSNNGQNGVLDVVAVDADADPMNVTFYGREKNSDFWTLIVLSDTQYYTMDSEWDKGVFPGQTQWIVDNREALNIQMVLSAGDITEDGSIEEHWARADTALTTLIDANIPYMPTPGDHDHVDQWEDGSLSLFTSTFPESRFSDDPWWGGAYDYSNSSHYVLLTIGLDDYIFIGLDFCPDDDEIEWANELLNEYSDRKAIFITHGLMDDTGDFYATSDCGRHDSESFFIWDELVSRHDNLNLALAGHMHRSDGEYQRTDDNVNGVPVHLATSDYQGRTPDGGNGLLRIMKFFPASNEIRVQTYSTYYDTFETDEDSEFTLPYEMTDDNPFVPIGTVTSVSNGAHATWQWTGLKPGATYEWYAVVSDGVVSSASPVWSFIR